jgi:hypothetical protein
MDMRQAAKLIAAGRTALGIGILVAPEQVAGRWLGPENLSQPLVKGLARMLAARDLALGVASLQTLDDPVIGPRIMAVAAIADTVDTLATVGARSVLPRAGTWGTAAIAGATAAAGFYLSHRIAHEG